jgi:hypothetical protein
MAPACQVDTMELLEETDTKPFFWIKRLLLALVVLEHTLEGAAVSMGVYDYRNDSGGMDSLRLGSGW